MPRWAAKRPTIFFWTISTCWGTLVLASHGVLDELPTAELRAKTSAFVRQFRADVSGTMDKITATGKLEPEMVDAILNAWKAYAGGDSHAVQ